MFVTLNRDAEDEDEGLAAINTELVTCLIQNEDDVDIFFIAAGRPLTLSNTTVEEVLAKFPTMTINSK